MSDKPKGNQCYITFSCSHGLLYDCVYFSGNKYFCKHFDQYYWACKSKVAKVNRMTLELKKQTGEI